MATEEQKKDENGGEYEHQPRDPVIAEGDYLGDLSSGATASGPGVTAGVAPNADAPSELLNPYMSAEDQNMEMEPVVVGPPGYASPDPATSAGRLLPLEDHPLNTEHLPEEVAGISEDYGEDVLSLTVPASGEPSGPIAPEAPEAVTSSYEEMTKADLQNLANERDVEISSSDTKAEIIEALEANDEE